jgi:hypothetical protein
MRHDTAALQLPPEVRSVQISREDEASLLVVIYCERALFSWRKAVHRLNTFWASKCFASPL